MEFEGCVYQGAHDCSQALPTCLQILYRGQCTDDFMHLVPCPVEASRLHRKKEWGHQLKQLEPHSPGKTQKQLRLHKAVTSGFSLEIGALLMSCDLFFCLWRIQPLQDKERRMWSHNSEHPVGDPKSTLQSQVASWYNDITMSRGSMMSLSSVWGKNVLPRYVQLVVPLFA